MQEAQPAGEAFLWQLVRAVCVKKVVALFPRPRSWLTVCVKVGTRLYRWIVALKLCCSKQSALYTHLL